MYFHKFERFQYLKKKENENVFCFQFLNIPHVSLVCHDNLNVGPIKRDFLLTEEITGTFRASYVYASGAGLLIERQPLCPITARRDVPLFILRASVATAETFTL